MLDSAHLPRRLLLLGAALLAFALPACMREKPLEPVLGAAPIGPRFVFAQADEPRTLDPGLITDTYGGFLVQNLFEGLLVWDEAGGDLLPGVAERHEVSPDGLVWTFFLRHDAIWSNGDPVTASDFLVAWRRVLNPSFGSDYASLLFPILGARALAEGEVVDAGTLGVEVRDRFTLVVTLEHPTPWFGAIVAHHVASPVNAAALKRHGHGWWQPGNIVVNGPFLLSSWVAGERIVLAKNPWFHAATTVRVAEVEARLVPDPDEVLRLYEAGELDWTGNSGLLPAGRLAELGSRADARRTAELGTAFFWLNTNAGPLADVRVRRALSLALDRDRLAADLGPGDLITGLLVPPGMPKHTAPEAPAPDAALAQRLLSEAGFAGGLGFPSLELAVDARPIHQALATTAAARWHEVLGVTVTPYVRQYSAHSEAVRDGAYQIARGGWLGDYPDASSFLDLLRGGSPLNSADWRDEGYDSLLDEARRAKDPEARRRMLSRAEAVALAGAPLIPLYNFGSLSLLKPWVDGFTDNPLQVHLLRYLTVGRNVPSMTSGSND